MCIVWCIPFYFYINSSIHHLNISGSISKIVPQILDFEENNGCHETFQNGVSVNCEANSGKLTGTPTPFMKAEIRSWRFSKQLLSAWKTLKQVSQRLWSLEIVVKTFHGDGCLSVKIRIVWNEMKLSNWHLKQLFESEGSQIKNGLLLLFYLEIVARS